MTENIEDFDLVIRPNQGLFRLNVKDLIRYKDLLSLFIRRDIVVTYAQSILGPAWFLITALISALVFVVVFAKIGQIPTDGLPPVVFYMSGITIWNYFASSVGKTQDTLAANIGIYGKIYFPRIYVPLASLISNLVSFSLQFLMLIIIALYFQLTQGSVHLQWTVIFVPLVILCVGIMSLGIGLAVSALCAKYRDVLHVWGFAITLMMYATPIVFPASRIPENWRPLLFLNPLATLVESYRYLLFGVGRLPTDSILFSIIGILVIFFFGLTVFSKVEKTYVDTV